MKCKKRTEAWDLVYLCEGCGNTFLVKLELLWNKIALSLSTTEKLSFFINVPTQQTHQRGINVETTLIINVRWRWYLVQNESGANAFIRILKWSCLFYINIRSLHLRGMQNVLQLHFFLRLGCNAKCLVIAVLVVFFFFWKDCQSTFRYILSFVIE